MNTLTLIFSVSITLLLMTSLAYADRPENNESPIKIPTIIIDTPKTTNLQSPQIDPARNEIVYGDDAYPEQNDWELKDGMLRIYMSNKLPSIGERVEISCESKLGNVLSQQMTPELIILNKENNREIYRGQYGVNVEFNTTQDMRIVCVSIMNDDSSKKILQATYVFNAKTSTDPRPGDFDDDEMTIFSIINDSSEDSTAAEKPNAGNNCNDCTPPTLGYNSAGEKKVDNGVCINDSCMDGGYFHTEYPMQSTLLFFPNVISTTYYENHEAHNIKLVQLGLGISEIGAPISTSQVLIEVWLDDFRNDVYNPSIKEIIIVDPDEIISAASADVNLVKCMDGNETTCLKVNFNYSYAKVPDSTKLVSNAIDYDHNTINNYFNDGLMVIHDSPEITNTPEIESKSCITKSVLTRNNPCIFLPLIDAEIKRAQDYLDQLQ